LITEYYREQNALLHSQRPDYGANGHRHAPQIRELAQAMQAESILDYGCGKGTLADALEGLTWSQASDPEQSLVQTHAVQITRYDPAFPQWAAAPAPADLVVCGDVLEHIEPDCIEAVLDDLVRVTRKCLYATIATRPAKKTLPDGRNTHLIQKDLRWWLPQLWCRFTLGSVHNLGGELLVICGPK
jgi:2-polyprenyl-3-methyl-5-hydroxy-6-metoxy-1,4-benzoquinol methylase